VYPELIKIGNFTISSFGVFIAIAFMTALYFARKEMAKRGLDPDIAYDMVIIIAVLALIGARAFYVIGHWQDYYAARPGDIIAIWKGGLVFYGGLLGGAIGVYLYSRYKKLNIWTVADSLAAPLAIGIGIGRIGCFLYGCCFGVASNSFFALHFPGNGLAGKYIPTQLIEMTWGFIMFAVLYFWVEKKYKFKKEGIVFVIFLLMYSGFRFLVGLARRGARESRALRDADHLGHA
jgi:phosphatidylglycerol---prolipoprotein diacylglyceryl transferase